ncbi:hypothetical protein BD779DRAFT_1433639 [Infundibulicybe gibba]|nr:hypothetical protein BD779DRAFT_1433639 [Infundibulicybe gibba]
MKSDLKGAGTDINTSATLRTLYSRAARAFLHRDITLTYTLLESAFSLLHPPAVSDHLGDHRRKWDILRITLETTTYSSPPDIQTALPPPLRTQLLESPHTIITTCHKRSLALFTPGTALPHAAAAYLPPQVLVTLVYSSLKLGCADIGRTMIEEWLARRDAGDPAGEGYAKVLELYTLQVLPELQEWEYAKEFLEYEAELTLYARQTLKTSLQRLHQASSQPRVLAERPYSPAPSSSSSSSLSTTSTHTVVPATTRPRTLARSSLSTHTRPSSSSSSSDSTATPRAQKSPSAPNAVPSAVVRAHSRPRTGGSNSSAPYPPAATLPRAPVHPPPITTSPPHGPALYRLLKAALVQHLGTPRVGVILLCILVPLLSFILRLRHVRRRPAGLAQGGGVDVDAVRRRLVAAREGGVLGKIWGELTRSVIDTVRMGGSGLV